MHTLFVRVHSLECDKFVHMERRQSFSAVNPLKTHHRIILCHTPDHAISGGQGAFPDVTAKVELTPAGAVFRVAACVK